MTIVQNDVTGMISLVVWQKPRDTVVESRCLTGEYCLHHTTSVTDESSLMPSIIGHPTTPTQPFIVSRSINWVLSNFVGCVPFVPCGECSQGYIKSVCAVCGSN